MATKILGNANFQVAIPEDLLIASTKNYRHNLLINCPFCYRRYAYKETLMHHIHAIHQKEDLSLIEKTGVPVEPNLANVPKLAKVTEMKGTTAEVVHGSSSAYQIPGSLRMRPGMSSRSYMRPDWDSPVTGITKVPDHRRKFKINQFKKMMLVKDGKVVEFRYQSNSTKMNGKKVFFKNRKGDEINGNTEKLGPSTDEDTFFVGNQNTKQEIISVDSDAELDVKVELLEEDVREVPIQRRSVIVSREELFKSMKRPRLSVPTHNQSVITTCPSTPRQHL